MPVLPGFRSVALVSAALMLCASPSIGQTKIDQSGVGPTMILVPDPNPAPSPTFFVDTVYPETTAYLKAVFPDLLDQIAVISPAGDGTTMSAWEISRTAMSLIHEQQSVVEGSVFAATEEEHVELLDTFLGVITDMQDKVGEVECSRILADGAASEFAHLLKYQLVEEFAPRVDALAKRHFEIAAKHPEGATEEEMQAAIENLWPSFYNYLVEQGVPQAYVDALQENEYLGSGILCTAHIRGLSALLAAPGDDAVMWRRTFASDLDLF